MYVPPKKVMIYPGAKPMCAYSLINGQVIESWMAIDPVTHLPEERIGNVLRAGKIIGEKALLINTTQRQKYRTVTPCDFLVVPAEIFTYILNITVKPSWDHIILKLKYFPQFQDYGSEDMLLCARNCIQETFEPGQTVLGDGYGFGASAYFITHGICQLIHDFDMDRINLKTSIQYRLVKPQPEIIEKAELDQRKR